MASGAPVIAYADEERSETVTDETGIFFKPQTTEAMAEALRSFEQNPARFTADACRARAAQFQKRVFSASSKRSFKKLRADRDHLQQAALTIDKLMPSLNASGDEC